MNFLTDVSPLIKTLELKQEPVIITINNFDEESAAAFSEAVSMAHNTGQKVIPVIIDSYGGQAYSLLSMISTIKSSTVPVATIVRGKAMSCGAPVICGRVCSLPEVAGGAACYSDLNPVAFLKAMQRLYLDADYRKHFVERGRLHVDAYDWQYTADLTHQVYRSTMS